MAKSPFAPQDNGVVKDASTPLNDSLVVGGGVVLGASSAGETTGSDSSPSGQKNTQATTSATPPTLRAEAGETVVRGTWSAVLQDGKTVYQSGTTIIDGKISLSNGASLYVTSGAVASAVDTTAGGIANVYVQSGGVLVSSYIENGYVTISGGGITSANRLNSDPVYISSGGTSIDDVMYTSGFWSDPTYVYSGGVVINPIVNSGGTIYGSGGTISGGVVGSGGYISTNGDTTTSGIAVSGGGSANLSGNVEGGGTVPSPPPTPSGERTLSGTWTARDVNGVTVYQSGNETVSGRVRFNGGASLTITSGAVVSGITMDANFSNVYISAGGTFEDSSVTNGWVYLYSGGLSSNNYINSDPFYINSGGTSINDVIYADGYGSDPTYVSSGGSIINPVIQSGGTVSVYSGGNAESPSVSGGGQIYIAGGNMEACFLEGTEIETPDGPVKVEDLKVGADVIDNGPEKTVRRIVWIGHREAYVGRDWAEDPAATKPPVRVVRNALGPNVPYKDLLVTDEHCIAVNNKLHPVRMLVNGQSIFYDEKLRCYRYYHIETDIHCMLGANGAPCESYLRTENHDGFGPDATEQADVRTWENDAVLPLDVSADTVQRIYQSLAERAVEEGFLSEPKQIDLVKDNGLQLRLANGQQVSPYRIKDGTYYFTVPAGNSFVWLNSRASRPSDTIGPYIDDRRLLGVLVAGVRVGTSEGEQSITHHLNFENLTGWHGPAGANMRWTNGSGKLPLVLDAKTQGEFNLQIDIINGGPYLGEAESQDAGMAV